MVTIDGCFKVGATNVVMGPYANTSISGTYNTILGYLAGNTITSGTYNTVIGQQSTAGSSTNYSTAIGSNSSVTANYSVAIGPNSTVSVTNRCFLGSVASPLFTQFYGRGFMQYNYNTPYTTGSSHTITAAQFLDGFLEWKPATSGADSTFYLPNANGSSGVVQTMRGAIVGSAIYGYIGCYYNGSTGTSTMLTITPGTNMSYYGPTSINDGESTFFIAIVTGITSGSETMSVLSIYD